MVQVKLSSASPFTLNVAGLGLSKTSPEPVAFSSVFGALVRYSDKNLDFIFEESDREELMQLNPEKFNLLSRELGTEITTHEQLCSLLLPKKAKKPKAKKPATKPIVVERPTVSE